MIKPNILIIIREKYLENEGISQLKQEIQKKSNQLKQSTIIQSE